MGGFAFVQVSVAGGEGGALEDRWGQVPGQLSAPDVDGDGQQDDQPDRDALHGGGDGVEVEAVLHDGDDQDADQRVEDMAATAGQAGAADDNRCDGLQFDQRAVVR